MINWEMNVHRQYRDELIKQAEDARIAQEIIADQRKLTTSGYHPALAWVGRRMLTVGNRLMKMSGEAARGENSWTPQPDIHLN